MRGVESNFWLWLSDRQGRRVSGSLRRGHNVLTDYGANWLAELASWGVIGENPDLDSPVREDRVRWLMLGSGYQLEVAGVTRLVNPFTILPAQYLYALPAPARQPTSAVRYLVHFTGASAVLDHLGASVNISEAGLFVDYDDGGGPGLNTASADHTPVFYRSFDPLTVDIINFTSLDVLWELRF